MMNRITVLGSGTSTGVPILGCPCVVCKSYDLRNKRLRTSAMIEFSNKKQVLIDASPDLRTQLLANSIQNIDAVIITHDHADHTHGMDDLRPFGFKSGKPLPVYADEKTSHSLENKFPYIFQREKIFADKPILGGGIPLLDLHPLKDEKVQIEGQELTLFPLSHGYTHTLGVLHSKMAYITDCKEIPEATLHMLKQRELEVLLIDCLRLEPHSTHLHLDQTLEYVKIIRPKLAVLIHMGHELDYLELMAQIRMRSMKNVLPALDGMSFLYS